MAQGVDDAGDGGYGGGVDGAMPDMRTHPAIKALAAAMGLAFGVVLSWPYLEAAARSWLAPAPAPEARPWGRDPGWDPGRDDRREPFRGVTVDGAVAPGLFPVRPTGAPTAPVVKAAQTFLSTLSLDRRAMTDFGVDDARKWRDWAGGPRRGRRGIPLGELAESQQAAMMDLARVAMSPRGFRAVEGAIRRGRAAAGPGSPGGAADPYHVAVLGTPSSAVPWGWQLDGPGVAVNYFVLGDQVVMSPFFLGAERAAGGPKDEAEDGAADVLSAELEKGTALARSLDGNQRRAATLRSPFGEVTIEAGPHHDNAIVRPLGVPWGALHPDQREQLLGLIAEFVGYLNDGHARVKMDEVRAHLDATRFAWSGRVDPGDDAPCYFRIQSPVLLVELERRPPGPPGGMGGPPGGPPYGPGVPPGGPRWAPAGRAGPGDRGPIPLAPMPVPGGHDGHRVLVQAVVRTPNGNDYGSELLRQHREAAQPAH